MSGLDGDDLIDWRQVAATRLNGDAGNDTALRHRGRDTLLGGDDNDVLIGGRGRDTLDGGAGDDRLDGGQGRDLLTGGDGVDTFVFADPGKPDKITDFADGDIVALDGSSFTGIGPAGALDAKYFHLGSRGRNESSRRSSTTATRAGCSMRKQGSQTADPVKFAKIGKDLTGFDAARRDRDLRRRHSGHALDRRTLLSPPMPSLAADQIAQPGDHALEFLRHRWSRC